MMKPIHTMRQSAAPACLAGVRPNELQSAADTLEKLQAHNFEVLSILSATVAQYVCDRCADFTLDSDKGLKRLRYQHTVSQDERPIVQQRAKALFEEGRAYCSKVLEQQLNVLARAASSVRNIREGVSLTFPGCVDALRDAVLLGLHLDTRHKAVLQKDSQAVKEIISLFRKYASELNEGNIPLETETSPAKQTVRSHRRNRLRMPAVPGERRRWQQGSRPSKQPVQTVRTTEQQGEAPIDTSVYTQPPSAEQIAFFSSWLMTDFGVKPAVADQLAPLFTMDVMESLVGIFREVERPLVVQLGARHPHIFDPRRGESWSAYVQLLREATQLLGGIDQLPQYLGRMESSQTLKSLVKDLKRSKWRGRI